MRQRQFLSYILIGIPLIYFLTIYGPLLLLYIIPRHIVPIQKETGFTITVPKIEAQANIVEQVDPWKETIYNEALQKGVAQAKNSVYPNQSGTIFLFAHSSTWPWELTTTNTPFLRLNELTKNDAIYITWRNKLYLFRVTTKKEVWPSETSYLTNLQKTQLILQTCIPPGTSFKRLLVFAKLSSTF